MTQQHQEGDQTARRAVTAIAVLAAALGLILVARVTFGAGPAFAQQTEVMSDGLSVWVEDSRWLSMDMDGDDENGAIEGAREDDTGRDTDSDSDAEQGFAMPDSMMPGAPVEGFQRLQVSLSLLNRGEGGVYVEPADFVLVAPDGDRWLTLLGGTFYETTLGTGQALSTVVAFDVPVEEAALDMDLTWSWQGNKTRFTIAGAGGGGH